MAHTLDIHAKRRHITALFVMQGLLISAIIAETPDLKYSLLLSQGFLTVLIGLISLVGALGSVLADYVARHHSSLRAVGIGVVCQISGVAALALSAGIYPAIDEGQGFTTDSSLTCARILASSCICLYAVGLGMIDAAGNMQAVAIQRRMGKVILGSFFASWSVGAICGALTIAAMETIGAGFTFSLLTAAGIGAVLGAIAAFGGLSYRTENSTPTPAFTPSSWKPIWAVGAAMALFYAIEYGLTNWSPLYLYEILGAPITTGALAIGSYQIAGLIARATADRWVRRCGESRVLRAAAIVTILGLVITLTAPTSSVSIIGITIVGLGAPMVAPLCFSTIAQRTSSAGSDSDTDQLDVIVPRVNSFNYVGSIVGGLVIGTLATVTSLHVALALPLVLAACLFMLAPAFKNAAIQRS